MRKFEKVAIEFQKSLAPTTLPTRATRRSAGYDFYLKDGVVLPAGKVVKVYTDVKAKMMLDEVLKLYVRSSVGIDFNIAFANGTGIIDADYYNNGKTGGNIILALYNYGDQSIYLEAGSRVAQGIFSKYLTATNDVVLSEDRIGGTGSSGK